MLFYFRMHQTKVFINKLNKKAIQKFTNKNLNIQKETKYDIYFLIFCGLCTFIPSFKINLIVKKKKLY